MSETTNTIPHEHRVIERTIGKMDDGESGYTVRWALVVAPNWECFLDPKHTLQDRQGGTSVVHVRRDALGYHVTVPAPEGGWQITAGHPGAAIPVASVTIVEG